MAFRDEMATSLSVARGDGTPAVEIGLFAPVGYSGGTWPASVVAWDKAGGLNPSSYFVAFANDERNPASGYLGVGQRGSTWYPQLRMFAAGGVVVQGSTAGDTALTMQCLDPLATSTGSTKLSLNSITTTTLSGAGLNGLTLDGGSNGGTPLPVKVTTGVAVSGGPSSFAAAPTLKQATGAATSMPGGLVKRVQATASSAGSTTAAIVVLDLGTITFVAGREYEIRLDSQFQSTIAGDSIALYLDINSANVGVGQVYLPRASAAYTFTKTAPYAPGAADVTGPVQVYMQRSNGTGTVSMFASATEPANLSVHDVGAS